MMTRRELRIYMIERDWTDNPRWYGVKRDYIAKDVVRLSGSRSVEHTHAVLGAEKLWKLLYSEHHVKAMGAQTGLQATQMVRAGLQAIYVSGWQVAADMNLAGETYPDQSLYPANSVPDFVARVNSALTREDEKQCAEGGKVIDWFAPIMADAEAGFGGHLNSFEIMKAMIRAGAAAVHFEDQLSSAKKCGHMGGKVVIPTGQFIERLKFARLAADIMNVPTILVARTDAYSARYLANDIDDQDKQLMTGVRTSEGYFEVRHGLEAAIARGLSYAPYADMLWWETSEPDLAQAEAFAKAIHAQFPGKLLAYNCSPSFRWKTHLSEEDIATFQNRLGDYGYKFQFVTLAGFHANNYAAFELAQKYAARGMSAYVELQEAEHAAQAWGYEAVKHQTAVGTGYFDKVVEVVSGGASSMTALGESTEAAQFQDK